MPMASTRQEGRQEGRQDGGPEESSGNRRRQASAELEERDPKRTKLRVVLNPADCNLDFDVNGNGLSGSALHVKGFSYCWSGARATLGLLSGRYCFGCKVTSVQKVDMPDTAADQKNLCRVGISRGDTDVGCLGESKNSFGYGGSGKFSTGGIFNDYGEKFYVGDTILCYVDLESQPLAKISFSKNGKPLGTAKEFDAGSAGVGVTEPVVGQGPPWSRALFPHVLLKNVSVQMMFSASDGLIPMHGFKTWETALEDGLAMEGPRIGNKNDCEVLMMVGLPASGKTSWAENWSRDHPDKRYVIIGTNLALDQMKVPGLQRKHNYAQRFEQLMSRATEIFNTLLDRAASTARNYIIDQTNVYMSARKRKLRSFTGFRKIAVVVVPKTEEHARRVVSRAKDLGKEVPVEAVHEMKANFSLPKSRNMSKSDEPFDEVWFVETQRQEAEQILQKDKASLPKPMPQHLGGGAGRPHFPFPGFIPTDRWGNPLPIQRGHFPVAAQGLGPSILGAPDQVFGVRGELLAQRIDGLGPRGEVIGGRGEIYGPGGDFMGPRGELLRADAYGSRGDLMGPRDVYGARGEMVVQRDLMGARGELMGHGDLLGQRAELFGQRGEPLGQRGELIGQRGELIGQRSELLGQRGELMGQRGELLGQRGELLGQRGELLGQRGELMGQRGDLIGQRSDLTGQRGDLIGQRGELLGQRGDLSQREITAQRGDLIGQRAELLAQRELIGPRGEVIGPRGEILGQRGELLGQRELNGTRDYLAQRGMHMPTGNGIPLPPYDALSPISPNMNMARPGFDVVSPTAGLPRSPYDTISLSPGLGRSGYDTGNGVIGGQRPSIDVLAKSPYDSGMQGSILSRPAYDYVGLGTGVPLGLYDAGGTAGALSRSPYDIYPNGVAQNMSGGPGPEFGGAPLSHVQSAGHRGPLLPLPSQLPSRQHFY